MLHSLWNFIIGILVGNKRKKMGFLDKEEILNKVTSYRNWFDEKCTKKTKNDHIKITKDYYDLATDIYEIFWGESFHFAPRHKNETLRESIIRSEFRLCHKLEIKPSDKVLDVGCGIMGPARNIYRLSLARITGLNINKHQVQRSKILNTINGLEKNLHCVEGDFTKMPFDDNYFDVVYSIEALCHSPDRLKAYNEIFRVLKPGGMIGIQDWGLTEEFCVDNKEHQKYKKMIEKGNGITDLKCISTFADTAREAGFKIITAFDEAFPALCKLGGNTIPWHHCFTSWLSFKEILMTKPFICIFKNIIWLAERFGLLPKGKTDMYYSLVEGKNGLEKAGRIGIFTPLYILYAMKPVSNVK